MSTEVKNPQTKYTILAALAAVGAAISIWQTRLFYLTRTGLADFKSFCNIGATFDCTAVEMSKYSELVSGIPLSALAVAGYVLILVLALMGLGSEDFRKNAKNYLVGFSAISAVFSLVYLVIMLTQIGKLCLMCLTVDVINVGLLVTSLMLPKSEPAPQGIRMTHVVGTGVATLIAAFLLTKAVNPQAEVKQEDMNDIEQSVLNAPVVNVQVPADAPVIGDPNAKVTIVKFSDYECPACRMGAASIHPLFKRYASGVKFVFVNYPLDQSCNPDIPRKMHEFACEAAKAAICGTQQGKFTETYETLFEHQKDFEAGKIADLLSTIPGMDVAKVKECMNLPSTAAKLSNDIALGGKKGMNIQSTPTFYINGKKVEGGLPTNLWVDIIDRMLKAN